MYTILREPRDPMKCEPTRYILPCPHCQCEFQFNPEDIIKREKRLGGYAWVKCPCCGEEIRFYPDTCVRPRLIGGLNCEITSDK